jgi:hypothetical protein
MKLSFELHECFIIISTLHAWELYNSNTNISDKLFALDGDKDFSEREFNGEACALG